MIGRPLEVGDRLPDLRVPLADGSPFVLSEDAAGLPVALVVASNVPERSDVALVVHVARPGGAVGAMSLLDDGQVAEALSDGDDVAIVADAAHRVVAVVTPDHLCDALETLPTPGDPVRRSSSTPLLVVDGVVSEDLRHDLLAHGAQCSWTPSPMRRPADDGVRLEVDDAKSRRDVLVADPDLVGALDRCLVRRLLPEVHRCLGHRITRHEEYKLVRYDADQGWFAAHRDNTAPGTAHRILAVTINLDDHGPAGEDAYDGGDLRFPELGSDLWRPDPGAAITFSCGLLHEVTPVTRGARHALVTFLS